jgi:hypothetical protein
VRLLRDRTGLGLKAARERIDQAGFQPSGFAAATSAAASAALPHLDHRIETPRAELQPRANGLAPGEVPRSNGAFWLVLLLLAVLAGYFLLM